LIHHAQIPNKIFTANCNQKLSDTFLTRNPKKFTIVVKLHVSAKCKTKQIHFSFFAVFQDSPQFVHNFLNLRPYLFEKLLLGPKRPSFLQRLKKSRDYCVMLADL